jgi:8-oxo-dGTP pyrophosphatase MutT (NUDIX family)
LIPSGNTVAGTDAGTDPITKSAFQKVTAFVTRGTGGSKELLTLVHPLAGRQLPAGSVEEGEDPHAAARREVWEEADLQDFTQFVLLDVESHRSNGVGFLCTDQGVRREPATTSTPSDVDILHRSHKVAIEAKHGPWVRVSHRICDFNLTPPRILEKVSGWVQRTQIACVLQRHYFHLITAPDNRKSWSREADGHIFRVEWVPLTPAPRLVAGQQPWLEVRYARLVADSGYLLP